MLEDEDPILFSRSPQHLPFRFESGQGITVVTHYPGLGQECDGGDQISEENTSIATRGEEDRLVIRYMTRGQEDTDPRDDLGLTIDEIEVASLLDWIEVVGQITRPDSLIPRVSELELAPLHDIPSAREGEADDRLGIVMSVPASMVEVEVSIDHIFDIVGRETSIPNRILETGRRTLVLDTVDLHELRVLLVTDTRIDQDECIGCLDEEAAETEGDTVPLISRDPTLPEDLGNHPEHRTTIEVLESSLEGMNTKIAKLTGTS